MVSDSDDDGGVTEALRAVLADPDAGKARLPQLLGSLDAEDTRTRLSGAWGLCLVADADPDSVDGITRRLADRLASDPKEGDKPVAAELAFEYVRRRYPSRVEAVLEDLAEEAAERARRRRVRELSRGGGFTRSDYAGRSDPSRSVGRTRVPESDSDPRTIYREEGYKVGGAPSEEGPDPGDGSVTDVDLEEFADVATQEMQAARERQEHEARLAAAAEEAKVTAIEPRSRFDTLQVVAPPLDGRYTDVYRTRAVIGDQERGLALCVFRQPGGDAPEFSARIGEQLQNWTAVSDHESVVTLYDWGERPHPWMAIQFSDETLYDRAEMRLEEALWNGQRIAEALSYAHQRGVLHTGLDPYTVVHIETLDDTWKRPLVTHFGLLAGVRRYFEPSSFLDPRYAAPEYFDRKFGNIDHATDIYHLGTVLYHLVTGQPPFDGSYGEVREAVLDDQPTPPSAVNPEIPEPVDEVVRKAMARQKLTRYETVTHLVADLERVREG
jgi:hypothetical protein